MSAVSYSAYRSVYDNQRPELDAFITNVFKQLDVDKFHTLFEDILKKTNDGKTVYTELLHRIGEAKGGPVSRLKAGLTALRDEVKTLSDNVAKIMDPKKSVDGYVEIGFPGRMVRPLTPLMGLQKNATVVNTKESIGDYLQSGFPRPYNRFIALDYNPLPIKEKSVDVISSFIGLHHCPESQLNDFAASIAKSLRTGGIFLLRDHDANSKKMKDLATVVHSVFNAATGVSVIDEVSEVRNFQGLEFWKKLLERHGMTCVSEPLVRDGDSTQNALVKFVKVENDDQLPIIREKLINKFKYYRPREQTHLTFTEWFNVESSQNVPNAKSFWDYSYIKDVTRLWTGFITSWKEARHVQSFKRVLFSDYTLMNSFITLLMSIDYIAKGILTTPLWLAAKLDRFLPAKTVDPVWEKPAQKYNEWLKTYGESLETTTFYAQKYLPSIKEYWSTFGASWNAARNERSIVDLMFDRQTLKNVVTGIAMTVDLLFRALTSTPVNWFFGGEEQGDARQIGILVKTKKKINNPDVTIAVEEKNCPYKALILPRYKKLEAILADFAKKGIETVEIAGQKEIQIDLVLPREGAPKLQGVLHERDYLPDPTKKIVAVQVQVADLHTFLNTHGHALHRIYDF